MAKPTKDDKIQVPKSKLQARWGALKTERASWVSQWREISEVLLPRNGRFFLADRDKGQKRHNQILDNTGSRALNILAAGLMSGMTSPARPWFALATSDQKLMEVAEVKKWLHDVTVLMHNVFQRSNTYRALHTAYLELGAFGTAAIIVEKDYNNVIHHFPLTIGEYAIATNMKGNVNTLYREFQKQVHEIVEEFGYDKCSQSVKAMYDAGTLDAWVTLVHVIEPRADRDPTKKDSKNMPWRSVYFESGGGGSDTFLRESGFKTFPALCPRWSVTGGDIYGNGPGMEALGDIKQLQHEQLRKAQGIDYMTKPPIQVPMGMKNRDIETLPGGVSYVDAAHPGGGIRTAFEVRIDLNALLGDIQDVRQRIHSSFFADLFLAISGQQDPRMTATEVSQRVEEKMLMLGPVLERLQNELLDPLIEITFEAIMEAGIAPPIPEELSGQNIQVVLVSMLAQSQRAIATNSIDRFVQALEQWASVKPEVLDRLDSDSLVDSYSDALGINPHIVVAKDEADKVRQARAQAQAQQAQAAQAQQQAQTAQTLSQTPTGGQNALTDIAQSQDPTRAFSGYAG